MAYEDKIASKNRPIKQKWKFKKTTIYITNYQFIPIF